MKCTSLFMLSPRIIIFLAKRNFYLMLFLFTVGKQDAKCGHLGTTFAVFIHLSSTFAGWWNFVFQTIILYVFLFLNNILTAFGRKMTSQDSKIKILTNDVTKF